MASVSNIRAELRQKQDRVSELLSQPHSSWTSAETGEAEQLGDSILKLRDDLDQETAKRDLLERLGGKLSAGDTGPNPPSDHELKQAAAGVESAWAAAVRGGTIATEVPRKALLAARQLSMPTGGVKASGNDDLSLLPSVASRIVPGDYATVPQVGALFTQAQAAGPTVRTYRVADIATADTVAEGEVKPDAGVTVDYLDLALVKIANKMRISDELAVDAPSFAEAFQTEMIQAVRARENQYTIETLLGTSGLQTASAGNAVDAVSTSVAQLAAYGVAADSVVLGPSDVAALRQTRGNDGRFLLDPLTAGPPTLWGLRLVTVTGLEQGTVLIGDFRSTGTFYARDALRIEAALSGDDFERNTRSLRCEERVGLAVTKPTHMVRATVTSAA